MRLVPTNAKLARTMIDQSPKQRKERPPMLPSLLRGRSLGWRLSRTWRRNPRFRSGRYVKRRWETERAVTAARRWRVAQRQQELLFRRHAPGLLADVDTALARVAELVWEVPAAWRRRGGGSAVYIAAEDVGAVRRCLRRLAKLVRALQRVVLQALGHGAAWSATLPAPGRAQRAVLAALFTGIGKAPPPSRLVTYEARRAEATRLIRLLAQRFGSPGTAKS